jgi:hypothetical protein
MGAAVPWEEDWLVHAFEEAWSGEWKSRCGENGRVVDLSGNAGEKWRME